MTQILIVLGLVLCIGVMCFIIGYQVGWNSSVKFTEHYIDKLWNQWEVE